MVSLMTHAWLQRKNSIYSSMNAEAGTMCTKLRPTSSHVGTMFEGMWGSQRSVPKAALKAHKAPLSSDSARGRPHGAGWLLAACSGEPRRGSVVVSPLLALAHVNFDSFYRVILAPVKLRPCAT